MRLEPDSPQRINEQRRYFPDWTRRVLEVHEELEADHNSYLAGGYAEEFGYCAQAGASRGVPLLDGESPEDYAEWLARTAAIHPGFPLRAYPIALPTHAVRAPAERPRIAASIAYRGTYVTVTDRPAAATVLTRVLAALRRYA